MGEDQSADEAEQPRDDQRDQKRSLERVANGEALAGESAADQPLAGRQPMR